MARSGRWTPPEGHEAVKISATSWTAAASGSIFRARLRRGALLLLLLLCAGALGTCTTSPDDCGPDHCQPCETGCVPADICRGHWICRCLCGDASRPDGASAATPASAAADALWSEESDR